MQSLKIILELLPEADRPAAIKEKNKDGNTVFHQALQNYESLKIVLKSLRKSDLFAVFTEKAVLDQIKRSNILMNEITDL